MKNRWVHGLALMALMTYCAPATAADKDLGQGTLMFMSIDDFKSYRTAMEESDFAAFTNDPQIKEIWGNLKRGFTKLISSALNQASSEDQEAMNAATALFADYYSALEEHANGRVAVSFGFVDVEGTPQPDLIIHIQGGDGIETQHQRIHEFLTKAFEEAPMKPVTQTLAGVSFKGFELTETPPPVPVRAPDGLFMGRKGNDYYIGLSKRGLTEYIEASTGNTAANRLGTHADYQRAVAAAGKGQVNLFMSFGGLIDVITKIAMSMPQGGGMAPGGEMAQFNHMMGAMGLDTMGVLYLTSSMLASGAQSKGFFGIEGRKGLMKFVPATNTPLSFPGFVPRGVMNASAVHAQLDQTLNIVEEIAVAIGGDMAKQQMARMFGTAENELGLKISDLFENLEGTLLSYQEPTAPGQAANPMMGMGAPSNMVLGLRLKDNAPMQKLFDTLLGHPQFSSSMRTEEFMEHKLYVLSLAGDAPPEFAAGIPVPAMVLHKDWFLLGLTVESIQTAIRTEAGGDEGRLVADEKFKKAMAGTSGNGMMLAYADQAKALGNAVDMIRPMIGFFPMMIPDIGQNPDLLFLFNANNLPSSDLFERYFGQTGSHCSVVDGGMLMTGNAPKVTKTEKK